MKLSKRRTCKTSTAIGVGLSLVFMTPALILADPENVLDNESSNVPIELQSPRRVITNADLGELRERTRVEVPELPRNEESNRKPIELSNRSTENLPLPAPNQIVLAIARSSSAKGTAAMRLIERGRSLLRVGEREKAVSTLEKALSLEANPYVYFYLSQAHYQLGHYQDALNFLEVAESWLDQQPDWVPEIAALKAQIPGSGIVQQVMAG
jgi:tetratricopeptide (TPR) repeat protein